MVISCDTVANFSIVSDFQIYVAVRTRYANGITFVDNQRSRYTKRATANWKFDGSGSVDAALLWRQTGSGSTGDSSLRISRSGDLVPVTARPTGNDLLSDSSKVWRWITP